jgi:hypothetical protein
MRFINEGVARTLNKQEVMTQIREYFQTVRET